MTSNSTRGYGKQYIGLLAAALVMVAGLALAAAPARSATTPAPMGHPRLFFNAADLPALRAQAASSHADIWQPIKAYVDTLRGSAPPTHPPDDAYEGFFAGYGEQLIPLSFVCALTEDEDYCALARTYLRTLAGWPLWSADGEVGLGHAHLLVGMALGYDWLYPLLPPEERDLLQQAIATQAQRTYNASAGGYDYEFNNFWIKSYMQNYYWITNSALGIAGLALLGEDVTRDCRVNASYNVNLRAGPGTNYDIVGTLAGGNQAQVADQIEGTDGYRWWQLVDGSWVRSDVVTAAAGCDMLDLQLDAQTWVDQARARIAIGRDILNSIGDGSWHESMYYGNYILTMTLPFWINLRALQGVDIIPHHYLQNYTAWQLYNHIPNSTEFLLSYGDFDWTWRNSHRPQNILRFIASEYDDGYAEWKAQQFIAADPRSVEIWSAPWYVLEFLYYNPDIPPRTPDDLPLARVFPDIEGVIWRSGWQDDAVLFGLKSSAPGGRFAFDTFTQGLYPWEAPCVESGCALATGHDHQDATSFTLYGGGAWLAPENVGVEVSSTAQHNAILIDGEGQYRVPDDRFGAYPSDFVGRDARLTATASSAGFNYLAADATPCYTIAGLQAVTRQVVYVRPDYFVMLDNLAADAPHRYEWGLHVTHGVTVEGNWLRGQAAEGQLLGVNVVAPQPFEVSTGDDGYPFVRTAPQDPATSTRMIHLLYPTDTARWAQKPAVSLLADSGQAAGVRVQRAGGEREDVLLRYAAENAAVTVGPYEYDGQVAVIGSHSDGSLDRLFVYGGTFLAADGVPLVDGLTATEPFEVRYAADSVHVTGSSLHPVTLYAPGVEQLTVNGSDWPFERMGDTIMFSPGGPTD